MTVEKPGSELLRVQDGLHEEKLTSELMFRMAINGARAIKAMVTELWQCT